MKGGSLDLFSHFPCFWTGGEVALYRGGCGSPSDSALCSSLPKAALGSGMKKLFGAAVIGVLMASCASSGKPKVATISGQELSKVFVAENLQVTSVGCGSVKKAPKSGCVITEIESTSTAPSNGGSETNRKNAMDAACAYALANAVRFLGQDVENTVTVSRDGASSEVSGSRESSDRSTDSASRQNNNETTTAIKNTIKMSASRYVKGWAPSRQEIVGPQEVSCTQRWSLRNQEIIEMMRSQK